MSENYCPSCGLQTIYGRTLAYYPDGPDLNKNICSKCGQTLMSADATIATLQRENEALRKKLSAEEEDHAQLQARCYEGFASASDGIFDAFAGLRATIATLQRENEALRKERDGVRDEYNAYVKESRTLTGEDTDTIFALRAEIATLQAQTAQLRADLEKAINFDEPVTNPYAANAATVNAVKCALAQTPTEALARWNAMARVCEAAQELRMLGPVPGRDVSNIVPALAEVESAIRKLDAALAALRSLDTKAGG